MDFSPGTAVIIGALLTFFLGYLQIRFPSAKPRSEVLRDQASAAKDVSDAWKPIVEELRLRIDRQDMKIDVLTDSVRKLRKGALILIGQLELAGITPAWRPEPDE